MALKLGLILYQTAGPSPDKVLEIFHAQQGPRRMEAWLPLVICMNATRGVCRVKAEKLLKRFCEVFLDLRK